MTTWCQKVIFYRQSNSNLDDWWIVELPLYVIIFSFHDKIGSMGEDKGPEDSSISYTGTFFLFLGCEECDLLLPVLRNGCACSLIDPFLFWRFCLQSVIWTNTLKDAHRKKHPKVKLQRLRKIRIWTVGSLVYQINSF